MKKSSIVLAIIALIVASMGIIYINKFYGITKNQNGESNKTQNSSDSQALNDIAFGEYKYTLSDNDVINARYIKTKQATRIYSLYPVDDKSKYDISQDGGSAVYLGKDGHLWILYNDGTVERLTPESYESIDKLQVQKSISGYIWADKPVFTQDGIVRFISNLPDTSSKPQKSIWEINVEDKSLRKIYTPSNDSYKLLGYKNDGKMMILDGDNIVVLSLEDNSSYNINVKEKYIISLSPDGSKIIYVKRDKNNQPDFKAVYVMDESAKNSIKLPQVNGYNATEISSWYFDGSKYGFIVKSIQENKYKLAVADFDHSVPDILSFDMDSGIKIPPDAKLRWIDEFTLSIDIGDDVVNINLN